jgi:hypothetical protein
MIGNFSATIEICANPSGRLDLPKPVVGMVAEVSRHGATRPSRLRPLPAAQSADPSFTSGPTMTAASHFRLSLASGLQCVAWGTVLVCVAMGLPGAVRPPASRPGRTAAALLPGQDGATVQADLRAAAREAYVWGWPLAYVHQCRTALEKVPFPGRSGGMPVAPLNRLSMLVDTIVGRTTLIPCPNQDVIYGFGVFDLQAGPVVIQVPDFGDRIWLYQLGDQRTDSFADVGCMHGTRPGAYLVAGPAWNGTAPPGIAGVFRCPTRYAYCVPRVFFTGEPGDREAALPAVNRILAYPLDEFDGGLVETDWSRARWLPAVAIRARRNGGVTPAGLLQALPEILVDVPPLPGEEPLYARLRHLVDAIGKDPALAAEALAAAEEADSEIVAPLFHFRNVGRTLRGHWTTLDNGGAFGTDYVSRTAAAKSNVFVNRSDETRYYYLDLDATGRRLTGDGAYRITFPAGGLPPSRGFWSLTVYDEKHQLPGDVSGRLSLGSRDPDLVLDADGSLSVTIGPAHGSPGPATRGNRLAAPSGEFSIYLRIYWPDTGTIDGGWTPPAAHRLPDRGSPVRVGDRVTTEFAR